jgi:hypothetical protein
MSSLGPFVRKIVYLVAICLLLAVLYPLSHPSTIGVGGTQADPGGRLAQIRAEHGLSETQLGEIDPTGETIQLATLGMRGVAANILWEKAFNYKKKKDWTNLSATLQQITKLQPHFLSVWRFQAWNLSYNVSAEFDDFRQRFLWVVKGIDFLKQGIRYNDREPRLYWDLAWFTSQKVGRADESKQFRKLFRDPDDFYGVFSSDPVYPAGSRPMEFRDNWLVGKDWYGRAEELAEEGAPLRGMSPLLFYSDRPMCQMNYSEALEGDGIFKEKAKREWAQAGDEWYEFGSREIPTTSGELIRLNEYEDTVKLSDGYRKQLEEMSPGLREKILEDKRARLSKAEREALDTPWQKMTQAQQQMAREANAKLEVDHREVAQRITGPNRAKALEIAEKLKRTEKTTQLIQSYRTIVNFEYWRRRAKLEQTDEALAARELIYDADEAFRIGDLPTAKEQYVAGLEQWRKLLDKEEFAGLVKDPEIGDELVEIIGKYRVVLDKRDEDFPKDFILQDVLDLHADKPEEVP